MNYVLCSLLMFPFALIMMSLKYFKWDLQSSFSLTCKSDIGTQQIMQC